MHRLLPFILLALLGLFGSGCVGTINDPERFGDLPLCREDVDVEALFRNKCGSVVCHGEGDGSGTGLDLVTQGVAERMVGAPAVGCEGQLLIDPDTPEQSLLTAKLLEPPAGCGSIMPIVGSLSAGEVACIAAWVEDAAENVPPVDAGMDAGTDAGMDAGLADAGLADAGPMDAGLMDGGAPDGGVP